MTPVQHHPGYYWNTNDPADLDFNEAGNEAPQSIRCYSMNDYINRGGARDVPVASLEYLAAGFLEGRMKKRRRNHRLWVDVEPPAPTVRNEVHHGPSQD